MKRESQVRHKLKQVTFRHRKKFVEAGLSRRPSNCSHNGVVRLPIHTGNRATIHICRFQHGQDDWNNRVCDSSMGGDLQARDCPFFESLHSVDSLKEAFNRKLGLGGEPVQAGVLAQEYPDIIALMWVLDSEKKRTEGGGEGEDSKPLLKEGILAFFGAEELEKTREEGDRD